MGRPPRQPINTPTVVADPTLTIVVPDEFVAVETRVTNLMLSNIGTFISEGLNEEEACLMANFDYDIFKAIKLKDTTVSNYIRKQFIKLKQKHLRVMQSNPSDKNSQWILEKIFPEEFGTSKKKDIDNPLNRFAIIIKNIQNDPNSHIIRDTIATDLTGRGALTAAVISAAEALG